MKVNFVKSILLIILILSLTLSFGCGDNKSNANHESSASTGTVEIDYEKGKIAMKYLEQLSVMGSRKAGSQSETSAANWIRKEIESFGYSVTTEPFSYEFDGKTYNSQNIIAIKNGNSQKTVVVGAHYDSVDVGNGVDDNGSGVALALELAKNLKDKETPQTLKFVFFGAEESDIQGSFYHVDEMSDEEIANTILMVNFDSLVAGEIPYVYGDEGKDGKFRDFALEIAEEKNLNLVTQQGKNPDYPKGTTLDASDHAAFKYAGIPHVYFESTNWDLGEKDGYTQVDRDLGIDGEIWHTQYDTLDYIKENFPGRIEERLNTFSTVTEALLLTDLTSVN